MSSAGQAYQDLVGQFERCEGVEAGQMFGKPCLKVHGKAFAAQHKDTVVFKLAGISHAMAMSFNDAVLWDPGGKGRPMKEWIALTMEHRSHFAALADEALAYVADTARYQTRS